MKKLLLILGVLLAALPMKAAYDFSAENEDGVKIYYHKLDRPGAFCEVVFGDAAYSDETINVPEYAYNSDTGDTYFVVGIGDRAFINATGVKIVTLPSKIEHIGEYAFENSSLKYLDIPITVKEIRYMAFALLTELEYITLECDSPEDITMGSDVFKSSFDKNPYLQVPKGSKSAYESADQWNKFGEKIYEGKFSFVHNNVAYLVTDEATGACKAVYRNPKWYPTGMGNWSLSIDPKITHKGVEYKVTSIDHFAFENCKLESVYLPETVTSIGQKAFYNNKNLKRVLIPGSIKEISAQAFADANLNKIVCESLHPATLSMGTDVFEGVDYEVCELEVPASVVGDYYECDPWNQFFYINERPYDFRADGLVYKIEGSGCYVAPNMGFDSKIYSDEDYIIPAAVTFDGTVYTVDGIKPFAFDKSTTLSVFSQNVRVIGEQAFRDSKIKFVYLPTTLEKIGYAAFVGCSDLTIIYNYVADPADIALDLDVFSGVNKESCTLMVPQGSGDLYRAASQWKDFTYIMEFETGIDNVATDAANADAPAVFYNLNGVAMPAGDLAPGLYIRRQGTDVSKVLIR